MSRRLISSGSTFERDIGYSRAVVQGGWVFVSGTTGFDYSTMTIAADGNWTFTANNVPGTTIATMSIAGVARPDKITGNYTVTFRAGGTAAGTVSLSNLGQ